MTRTKIVATVGPASVADLDRLLDEVDVVRLNFSHGSHETHGAVIERARGVGRAVLQDLCGPKLRVGDIDGELTVVAGRRLVLSTRPVAATAELVGVAFPDLPRVVKVGDPILLADGMMRLEVEAVTATDVICRVVTGGTLTSRKGINLPGETPGLPSLTPKDIADLTFGTRMGVDYVALSFVRRAEDVLAAKARTTAPVIAKIEKGEALANLAEILRVADGVMVARGDLGVEMPIEKVPAAQKRIIAAANAAGKPVITATQMLRSMVGSRVPTRAEVTDVANAVLDGTDAVMLSEETASGQYPLEAVRMMRRILAETDPAVPPRSVTGGKAASIEDSTSQAAVLMADELDAAAIAVPTTTGATARLVARFRPRAPILAFSPRPETVRRLQLVWGVTARELAISGDAIASVRQALTGILRKGERAVITAGYPPGVPGNTSLIHALEL